MSTKYDEEIKKILDEELVIVYEYGCWEYINYNCAVSRIVSLINEQNRKRNKKLSIKKA